jgi:nucleotide-binding universal stress UspA family protein
VFHHLVVAVDGSESSLRAFDRALDLAAHLGAALDVVSVEEEPPRPFYVTKQEEVSAEQSAAERYYGQVHAEATLRAAQRGVSVTTKVLAGHEGPWPKSKSLARLPRILWFSRTSSRGSKLSVWWSM